MGKGSCRGCNLQVIYGTQECRVFKNGGGGRVRI